MGVGSGVQGSRGPLDFYTQEFDLLPRKRRIVCQNTLFADE